MSDWSSEGSKSLRFRSISGVFPPTFHVAANTLLDADNGTDKILFEFELHTKNTRLFVACVVVS